LRKRKEEAKKKRSKEAKKEKSKEAKKEKSKEGEKLTQRPHRTQSSQRRGIEVTGRKSPPS